MLDDPQMAVGQRQEFLSIVVTETERLSRLVNQVLDMAKIESGHAQWHNESIDLIELLKQAAQTVHELVRERGAELVLDLPAQAPALRADRDRLMQVLLNLLSNAVKFVPPIGGRIELRLRLSEQAATVEVHDNGPGVPADQRKPDLREIPPGRRRCQPTAGHRPGFADQPPDRRTFRRPDRAAH